MQKLMFQAELYRFGGCRITLERLSRYRLGKRGYQSESNGSGIPKGYVSPTLTAASIVHPTSDYVHLFDHLLQLDILARLTPQRSPRWTM